MAAAQSLASLVLILTALLTRNVIEASIVPTKRLVTKLIHRDSIFSPYFNPNETTEDRIERSMNTSATRMVYLHSQTKTNDFQLNLLPSSSEPLLFVNFSLGQPPTPQMDTGSNILWVKCATSARHSLQTGPLLDPSKSLTYASLPCTHSLCRYAPNPSCDHSNKCAYNLSYLSGPSSVGVLATEELTFQTSDEGSGAVPNVIFGCSQSDGDYKDQRFTGIFGLGNGIASFVTQMGSKFSYCVGDITDPRYEYNQLVFGDASDFEGYTTPLRVDGGHYYISLEGISVGGKRLIINSTACNTNNNGNSNSALIDTGTAVTWLAGNFYSALDSEVHKLLDGVLTPFWRGAFSCYKGTINRDLIGFPIVTFHFSRGAELDLDTESLFYQATPDILCMAIRQAGDYGNGFKDFSVIGLMAQQNYYVAYDLNSNSLFFQRIDCELLVA